LAPQVAWWIGSLTRALHYRVGERSPLRKLWVVRADITITSYLRAKTFELSRYMGASLTMIDRHYGHLARNGREHAIRLLDDLNAPAVDVGGRPVDAEKRGRRRAGQRNRPLSRE
jgi:hypothetical protein